MSSAGDINGDGFADLVVGAPGASPQGANSGTTYVVFGHAGSFAATLDLATLNGATGFQIRGAAAGDYSGVSVHAAGDFNGDGFADLVIGAYGADPNGNFSGASYVLFGSAAGFAAQVELSTLDGDNGFRISGDGALNYAGYSVSGAGDVNGDGFDDLVVGAPDIDFATTTGGRSYVIFGGKPLEAVTRAGTALANTIHGGDFADTLSGLGGDDSLIAFAGNDVLAGGPGNDTLNGGTGIDTASFADDAAGVAANLTTGIADGAASGHDVLIALENLTGGLGSDTLTGDAGANVLDGGAGNDALDGAGGVDTASYGRDASGVTASLAAGVADGTASGHDTLAGIENLAGGTGGDVLTGDGNANALDGGAGDDQLFGGGGADALTGGDGADKLNGQDGNDTEHGGYGNDTLIGVAGDDVLYGDDGDDVLKGGAGSDTLNGGAGRDTASYADSQAGVTVDLGSGTSSGSDAGQDTLIGIENAVGGSGGDTLTGSKGDNTLDGSGGNDTLAGGKGNDILIGGGGADLLEGGPGHDTFAYASASESTHAAYDTLHAFNFNDDRIDLAVAVTGIDPKLAHGSLSIASFDGDLAGAVTGLGASHAMLYTPDAGTLAGHTFLIVDLNGVAGYQAGKDLVLDLDAPGQAGGPGGGDVRVRRVARTRVRAGREETLILSPFSGLAGGRSTITPYPDIR